MLDAILKIFQMRIAWEDPEEEGLPARISFTETEMECVDKQCKKMEGKTQKQKNPYTKGSLKYATWVIARLGDGKDMHPKENPVSQHYGLT